MTHAASPTPAQRARARRPEAPATLKDTGLSEQSVVDLILKTLYAQGARSGQQLTEFLRLPFTILDETLLTLQQRRMVEVRGTAGPSRGQYLFDLAGTGRDRAAEALDANRYVGPAPVPLEQYRSWVDIQSIRHTHVTWNALRDGFREAVLPESMLDQLGPAVNSAKSLFLYGDAGNGKTMIAETISRLLGGDLYLPYAVDVDGQIIVIFDPVHHRPVRGKADVVDHVTDRGVTDPDWLATVAEYDLRFAHVRRPVVLTGGELVLEQLDLQYDPHSKMYQAPFQVKANGGILIIDDFGRQRVPPRDMLNRWIVPLDRRVDFLTLHTGKKFPVPFDCLLIFATNLDPKQLVEEAFMRRIHYKIHVDSPDREAYTEIFRRCCAQRNVPYDPAAIDLIYREYYGTMKIPPRACHPRDILDHLVDTAKFNEIAADLNQDLVRRACKSYFLDASF